MKVIDPLISEQEITIEYIEKYCNENFSFLFCTEINHIIYISVFLEDTIFMVDLFKSNIYFRRECKSKNYWTKNSKESKESKESNSKWIRELFNFCQELKVDLFFFKKKEDFIEWLNSKNSK